MRRQAVDWYGEGWAQDRIMGKGRSESGSMTESLLSVLLKVAERSLPCDQSSHTHVLRRYLGR